MRFTQFLCGALLFCGSRLGGQSIPVTRAVSMAGTVINLPADFKGKPAILVLGFTKKSSSQTKIWGEAIDHDFRSDSKIAYFQLPMLQHVPRLFRSMVVQGIRSPLDSSQRNRFIPIFDQEAAWKSAAQFGAADDAYVLLVDGAGHVEWRSAGVFQEDKYKGLRDRVMSLK
jgi:hypothetical protein